jgi:wyosine [tRNA(Phe)-imidazoG37] synthetase (radical SAM superfamily)
MPTKPLNLFTLHSRNWQQNRYVYPVISRRSQGLSIGVNLNPDKICNFDCIYCCVDRRQMPGRVEVDLGVLKDELDHMVDLAASGEIWKISPFDQASPALKRINDIAFSGDGEPTSYLKFQEACALAAASLERAAIQDVKLVVITNATLFHQPRVQTALDYLGQHNGELWAKLDAGTEGYYRLVERTTIPFQRVLDNILLAGKKRPIVIQSLYMNIQGNPPSEQEIDEYVARLSELKDAGAQIKLVQVYTIARQTAESYVTPLNNAQVDRIAEMVRTIGLNALPFYGPT